VVSRPRRRSMDRRRFSNNGSTRMAQRAMATVAPSRAPPSAIPVVAMGRRPMRGYASYPFLSFRDPTYHTLLDRRKSRTLRVSPPEPGDFLLGIKSSISAFEGSPPFVRPCRDPHRLSERFPSTEVLGYFQMRPLPELADFQRGIVRPVRQRRPSAARRSGPHDRFFPAFGEEKHCLPHTSA
jgi:hypothetical protein